MPRVRLPTLLMEIRACRVCEGVLPLGPRPIVQWKEKPSLVIIGQAPGTRVHESGVPWDDDSGDHLRSWLGMSPSEFYDPTLVGIMPMGFCYPGRKKGGDAPPDPRCAPLWHERLLEHSQEGALVLLVGQYAQKHYLGARRKKSLTETVENYSEYLPSALPLPHPSWRSKIWMKKNPWFEEELLPRLRREILSRRE